MNATLLWAHLIREVPAHTYRFNITHILTPEANGSIHYWWFNRRDFKLDDPEADDYRPI